MSLLRKLLLLVGNPESTPPVRCSICRESYASAKPLVEGAQGALACAACIGAANNLRKLGVVQQRSERESTEENRPQVVEAADNPYRSPEEAKDSTEQCVFCGNATPSDLYFLADDRPGLCASCIDKSLALLVSSRHAPGRQGAIEP